MIKFPPPPGLCLLAVAVLAGPFEAAALITPAGTAANSSSSAAFAPTSIWNNVGVAGDSSGEYLGNGWIITANHVSRSGNVINFNLTIGGTTHYWLGTGTQLGSHDIFLAHLDPDGSGNLPDAYGATGVPLATSTPSAGTPTTLIGEGRTLSALNYYTVAGSTWTNHGSTNVLGSYPVYSWGATPTKTWGTNKIWGTTASGATVGGFPIADFTVAGDNALAVDFSNGPYATHDSATASETGVALNDSGSGMFVNVAGTWKLAGLVDTIDQYAGQPITAPDGTPTPLASGGLYTTTDGNDSYAIDLASYASQINAVIATPEPTTGALLGIAGTVFAASLRRRKRSRTEA